MDAENFRLTFTAFVEAQTDPELRAQLRQCLFNIGRNNLNGHLCFVVLATDAIAAERLKQKVSRICEVRYLLDAGLSRLIIYSKGDDPQNPDLVGVWEIHSPASWRYAVTPIL